MDINLKNTIFFLAILTTALSAGLFFAWTVSVIPGTKRITDASYLEVMQSINKAILNPAFFITFLGPVLLLMLSSYFQFRVKVDTAFWLVFGATIIYIVGTLGVTMFGNVPMNDTLGAIDLATLNKEGMSAAREAYENRWNQLNTLRTIAALVSFILLLIVTMSGRLTDSI